MTITSFARKLGLLAVAVFAVFALSPSTSAWARHRAPRYRPHRHTRAAIPWGLPHFPRPASASAPDAASLEEQAFALTNARRALGATCGDRAFPPAPPLPMNAALRAAARAHSADMGEGYRHLGVGYAAVEGSPLVHYWTQDFGR